MHRRRELPESLTEVAYEQAGVVTRSQAQACGLSRHVIERLRESGNWQIRAKGVYLTRPGDAPWMALAWAEC